MIKIPISMATPGMKLAKAATNDRGIVLCGQGTELTEKMIARLSDMGAKRIMVERAPGDQGQAESDVEELIKGLHSRFRRVERDPLMRKIKNVFLERLKQRANGE